MFKQPKRGILALFDNFILKKKLRKKYINEYQINKSRKENKIKKKIGNKEIKLK